MLLAALSTDECQALQPRTTLPGLPLNTQDKGLTCTERHTWGLSSRCKRGARVRHLTGNVNDTPVVDATSTAVLSEEGAEQEDARCTRSYGGQQRWKGRKSVS